MKTQAENEVQAGALVSLQRALRQPTPLSATALSIVFAAIVAVVVERVMAVACDLQLWGDGSWFLIKIASARGYYFWIGDWHHRLAQSRIFTVLVLQTPTVLATHLRIHSLHALSLIFGITLYSHALISLYICYRYATRRWYMLFPLLSFFAGTMNVEAYLSTDSHLIVSLYWPVLFILLFREEISGWTLVLLVGLSIPMVIAYESMLFFGAILAGVCAWRYWRFPRQRILAVVLAAWYLLGAGIALVSVIWPFDPTNRSGFIRGIQFLISSPHMAARVSLVVLLCTGVVVVLPSRLRLLQRLAAVTGMLAVLYLCGAVVAGQTPLDLRVEVAARVMNLFGPLAATGLLLVVVSGLLKPDRTSIALAALLVGSIGFGQALWNLAAAIQWQGVLTALRYDLATHEGPLPLDQSMLSHEKLGTRPLRDLYLGWALLPLSLYETGRGEVRSVVVESNSFMPFDPYAPDTMPDLSRYRIRYDTYREAVKRNWRYNLGQTLTFQQGGSASRFLRGNWIDPEPWAAWGSSSEFGVDLPLPADLPDVITLWAMVAPNLAPNFPTMTLQVLVNELPVGTWSFQYASDPFTTRTIQIPRSTLLQANPAKIRFRVIGPVYSPSEMGKGPDPRKLSVAFLQMRLQAAGQ